jgi:hypothetical protein
MIRFSHEANSWQVLHDSWRNHENNKWCKVTLDQARMYFDGGYKLI